MKRTRVFGSVQMTLETDSMGRYSLVQQPLNQRQECIRFGIHLLYVIVVDVELDMWSDAMTNSELNTEGIGAHSKYNLV
jgi:hypothetical protein